MAKFVAVSFLAGTAFGGNVALTWKDCGHPNTHGKISDVEPKIITLGTTTTVMGSGSVDEVVSGGSFFAKITAGGGIIKDSWSGDLCSASTKTLPLGLGQIDFKGMNCPVAVGASSLAMDVKLSGSIPVSLATADIQLNAIASSGDKLLCMTLHTEKAASMEEFASSETSAFKTTDEATSPWTVSGGPNPRVVQKCAWCAKELAKGAEKVATSVGNKGAARTFEKLADSARVAESAAKVAAKAKKPLDKIQKEVQREEKEFKSDLKKFGDEVIGKDKRKKVQAEIKKMKQEFKAECRDFFDDKDFFDDVESTDENSNELESELLVSITDEATSSWTVSGGPNPKVVQKCAWCAKELAKGAEKVASSVGNKGAARTFEKLADSARAAESAAKVAAKAKKPLDKIQKEVKREEKEFKSDLKKFGDEVIGKDKRKKVQAEIKKMKQEFKAECREFFDDKDFFDDVESTDESSNELETGLLV